MEWGAIRADRRCHPSPPAAQSHNMDGTGPHSPRRVRDIPNKPSRMEHAHRPVGGYAGLRNTHGVRYNSNSKRVGRNTVPSCPSLYGAALFDEGSTEGRPTGTP